ncbi:MAG: hypothetical protein H0T46_23475, partial [Deltaproteobacteria bacterium]|nr:hypothetical protein [Deltaproteobacteria bacterium]
MMPAKNLVKMVVANTLRSPRHFILSAFGIVIGIGAFVLFLALTQKAGHVLEEIFPLDEVQVVAPRVSLLGKDTSKRLDDSTVKMILARPEVGSAVPRMNLVFPAAGRGEFEGSDLKFEVGGFADGVDASFVQDDERIKKLFKDWDAIPNDPKRLACVPPPSDPEDTIRQAPGKPPKNMIRAGQGSAAPASGGDTWGGGTPAPAPTPPPPPPPTPDAGSGSAAGSGAGSAAPVPPAAPALVINQYGSTGTGTKESPLAPAPVDPSGKALKYYNPCPDPDVYYCDDQERTCKHRVPVVLSSTVVELYNNQFAKSHGMPMADENLVNFLIQNRGLSAMRFSIGLGNTTIAGTSTMTKVKPRRVEAFIVGVSSRAMQVGVTMPIQYITRWNREYMGEEAAGAYSSIIVRLKDPAVGLRLEDNLGERFATVIFVIRLLFLIISIAILVIAIINIGHNFFIQVSERRREIGIMRAVGATESDVMLIVLGEA